MKIGGEGESAVLENVTATRQWKQTEKIYRVKTIIKNVI